MNSLLPFATACHHISILHTVPPFLARKPNEGHKLLWAPKSNTERITCSSWGIPEGQKTNKNTTQHSRASATRLRSLSTEPFKDFFMELRVERTSTTIAGADL
jgi:hypothetical protein